MANGGRMVRDSAMVTMETAIALSNSNNVDLIRPLFPQNGVQNAPARTNYATRAATWRI